MKIYKLTLSALAFALVFTLNASAQMNDNADVQVTANVASALTISKTQDVVFGNIGQNTASYLPANASDSGTEVNVGNTGQPGEVAIAGNTGASIKVTFGSATLTDAADASKTATFTPTIYFGSTAVTSGTNITLVSGTTLDIGGGLAAISESGSYSTTNTGGSPLNIEVEYN